MKAVKFASLLIMWMIWSSTIMVEAQTDSTRSFSLAEAQEFAISNFYMTRNAELNIESAHKFMKEVTAIGLPQVSGGVDYTYLPEIPTASFPINFLDNNIPYTNDPVTGVQINDDLSIGYGPGEEIKLGVEHNISYNIMLTQLIFSGEYIVGLQASKTYMQQSRELYENTTIQLKQLIASTYYTILILERNEQLYQESVTNLREIYEQTLKTAEAGLMETIDADQISINLKRTENQLNYVQRQLEFMNKTLRYQLGLAVDAKVQLSDDLNSLIENNIIDEANLYIFNLEEHIEYKLLDTQEKLNMLVVKREKSKYIPSISAFYKYEDKFQKADLDFTMRHMVGVSLNVPIWESGAKNARVSQAEIALQQSQLLKDQESERLIMEAEQAKYDYITALEQFYNERDNFDLSKRVYDHTTEKYKQGMVSSMDLTIANNQYNEAQISYSTVAAALLNAKVVLDKAFSKL
jgi:outer membrane protein